jgi:hypothetical protein
MLPECPIHGCEEHLVDHPGSAGIVWSNIQGMGYATCLCVHVWWAPKPNMHLQTKTTVQFLQQSFTRYTSHIAILATKIDSENQIWVPQNMNSTAFRNDRENNHWSVVSIFQHAHVVLKATLPWWFFLAQNLLETKKVRKHHVKIHHSLWTK